MTFNLEGLTHSPMHLRDLLLAYVLLFFAGAAGVWCIQRASGFWQAWGVVMVAYSSLLIILFTFSVPAHAASELLLSI